MRLKFVLTVALVIIAAPAPTARAEPAVPRRMLWAWERNEDLRFLAGDSTGVAFLHATLRIAGEHVTRVPRRQPLRVAPSTYLVAVVRVEASPVRPPLFSAAQTAAIAEELALAAATPGVRGVQIDFDAVASQRAEYRRLLAEIRGALPKSTTFSMTALASWCVFDSWLDDAPLPVDEVVPMLFSMGPEGPRVLQTIEAQGELPSPACRSALGIAAGQPAPKLRRPHRTYVFNPVAWNEATLRSLALGGLP